MISSIATVFMAYIFAGEMEYTGMLNKILNSIKETFIKGKQETSYWRLHLQAS